MQTGQDKVGVASRALVVGLGATGLSVARWLASKGVSVAITDSRDRPPQLDALRKHLPDVALFLGGFSQAALDRADMVVLSPGITRDEPFVKQAMELGLPVIGDIELFARNATAPVVAVTGSNGKSTVATLVSMMAEQAGVDVRAGGNLGTPALDLLGEGAPDLFVLELSSFQLESTQSLTPAAAAVLNISADHMDRYADLASYTAAKAKIWAGRGRVIANRDDPEVARMVPPSRDVRWFGLGAPTSESDYGVSGEWLCRGTQHIMPISEVRIAGRHNLSNALAALGLGEAAGIPDSAMVAVLRRFRGLPHRMEAVGDHKGVAWFNDSKATNVGATLAAVSGLEGPLVMILGGEGKGQDFTPLANALRDKSRLAVVIGKDGGLIRAALDGVCPVEEAADMHAAVRIAALHARSGDMVLLSPACSSLDMFENYEARGRAFCDAVRSLQ